MNKIVFLGRLTKEVEMRKTGSDLAVAQFNLAVNNYKGEADFFNLTAFGKTAENIGKFVKKGQQLLVEGRVQNNNYEKDGRTIYQNSFIVEKFYFVSGTKNTKQEEQEEDNEDLDDVLDNTEEEKIDIDDDELPF